MVSKRKIKAKENAIYRKIARERIELLFRMAESATHELAKRYVAIARKVGMKTNVPIPRRYKMRFCQKCGEYLVFGRTASFRLDSEKGNIVIRCLSCGNIKRWPYRRAENQDE